MLPIWEDSKAELKDIYPQALQDAVQKVDLALKAFFIRVRNDEDSGNPKFKGKVWYDSITYPQSGSRWKATSCISLRPEISKYGSIGL
jgi:putative transposase